MIKLSIGCGEDGFWIIKARYRRSVGEQNPWGIPQTHISIDETPMLLVENRVAAFVVEKGSSIERNDSKGFGVPSGAH